MRTGVLASEPNRAEALRARDSRGCQAQAGEFVPVIDFSRCEAKAECVEVCPYGVLQLVALNEAELRGLGLRGRLKTWFHGPAKARAVAAAACRACGRCVAACPEQAIRLQRVVPGPQDA